MRRSRLSTVMSSNHRDGSAGTPRTPPSGHASWPEDLVFLNQDGEFEDLPGTVGAVIISRVPQRLPIAERVARWTAALEGFIARRPAKRLFEILATGELVVWEER